MMFYLELNLVYTIVIISHTCENWSSCSCSIHSKRVIYPMHLKQIEILHQTSNIISLDHPVWWVLFVNFNGLIRFNQQKLHMDHPYPWRIHGAAILMVCHGSHQQKSPINVSINIPVPWISVMGLVISHSYGKSPFLIGKPSISMGHLYHGRFSRTP